MAITDTEAQKIKALIEGMQTRWKEDFRELLSIQHAHSEDLTMDCFTELSGLISALRKAMTSTTLPGNRESFNPKAYKLTKSPVTVL